MFFNRLLDLFFFSFLLPKGNSTFHYLLYVHGTVLLSNEYQMLLYIGGLNYRKLCVVFFVYG